MDQSANSTGSSLRAWLQLFRVPNLFTVPGDPIAGFFLACASRQDVNLWNIAPCVLASLFLYMAGLVTNDLFDLEEDRRDRPARPLPSGRIGIRTAMVISIVLFALGLASAAVAGLAPVAVASVLTALILAYNARVKRVPFIGPLNMGLCRGLSLMLGAAAFGAPALMTPVILVAAGGLTLYILSVTLIAANETTGKAPGWLALLPCLTILLWLTGFSEVIPKGTLSAKPCLIPMAIVVALVVALFGFLVRKQTDVRRVSAAVGSFLQALLPIQACLVILGADKGVFFCMLLLLAWPLSVWTGRRFYAS